MENFPKVEDLIVQKDKVAQLIEQHQITEEVLWSQFEKLESEIVD